MKRILMILLILLMVSCRTHSDIPWADLPSTDEVPDGIVRDPGLVRPDHGNDFDSRTDEGREPDEGQEPDHGLTDEQTFNDVAQDIEREIVDSLDGTTDEGSNDSGTDVKEDAVDDVEPDGVIYGEGSCFTLYTCWKFECVSPVLIQECRDQCTAKGDKEAQELFLPVLTCQETPDADCTELVQACFDDPDQAQYGTGNCSEFWNCTMSCPYPDSEGCWDGCHASADREALSLFAVVFECMARLMPVECNSELQACLDDNQ